MSKFAILMSGDVTPTPRLSSQLSGARVIAADSGMKHAEVLAVSVELWVGDFDSSDTALQEHYKRVPRQQHPIAKDKTDGELAVDEALARGASEIILVGAFGGQFDHALAHVTKLVALAERNVKAFATSGTEEGWPLVSSLSLWQIPRGTSLSLVGLTPLLGLNISGVRWPLHKRDISMGDTLTLSNEAQGDISISLQQGRAVVLVYPRVKA
jgi:thiamine pyrophosphokinase